MEEAMGGKKSWRALAVGKAVVTNLRKWLNGLEISPILYRQL